MKIRRVPSRGLVITGLPTSHLRLLEQIPLQADPAGSAAAEDRLYPSPVRATEDDPDDSLLHDWQEYVQPDLRSDFARQVDRVTADLRTARLEEPAASDDAETLDTETVDTNDQADGEAFEGEDTVADEVEEADEEEEADDDAEADDEANEAPPETYELTIPFEHVDAWYGALNQARLVMQERYAFPEQENLETIVALLASENLKPYLTSRFYAEIQGVLLDLGMRADTGEAPGLE